MNQNLNRVSFLNQFNFRSQTSLKGSIIGKDKLFKRINKSQSNIQAKPANEQEKANLLYWQVTCEAFNTPEEWKWWFNQTGYTGDYSFIYFE